MLKKYKTQNTPSVEIKVSFDPDTKKYEKRFTLVFQKYVSAIDDESKESSLSNSKHRFVLG